MKVKVQIEIAHEYIEALAKVDNRPVNTVKAQQVADAIVLLTQQWLEDVKNGHNLSALVN